VANFQETSVLNVHLAGAMIAFGLGTVFLWSQVKQLVVVVTVRKIILIILVGGK
jgi:hypothetical protein